MKPITNLNLLLALTAFTTACAQETRYFRVSGPVAARIQGLTPDGFLTWTNGPTSATFTVQTASSPVGESNWVDFIQVPVTNAATTIDRLFDPKPPAGMVLIPAGSFTMGDPFSEEAPDQRPTHTVYVSGFYMDRFEVTSALWDEVYSRAYSNGYKFDNGGSSKSVQHPVHSVNWYDGVKWCNARSEKEGRVPAYYTSSAWTTVYRNGRESVRNEWVRWDCGYRLPTEAEWEKAARGGLSGKRFPWGDTITHNQANYFSWRIYPYGLSGIRDYHPSFDEGRIPYTSPVGAFSANGHGLCDMAGNVWEWCWDWFGTSSYASSAASDPRGPPAGANRLFRGGSWHYYAISCRAASRCFNMPEIRDYFSGFRSVLPPGQ